MHTTMLRRRTTLLVPLAVGAMSVVTLAVPAHAIAPPVGRHASGRHTIGSTPRWTARARTLGHESSTRTVDFGVLLRMRDQAGAISRLPAISDPASPSYGAWLTTRQFAATYAPTSSTVSTVRNWLTDQGFRIRGVLTSGMYLEASGTVAQLEKTFATTIDSFSYRGTTVRANTTSMSLPAETPSTVVDAIDGLIGVDQGSALKTPAKRLPGPPDGFRAGKPCSRDYYAQKTATNKPSANGKKQPYVVCGYGPKQYQQAYRLSGAIAKGQDGRGYTVAITDAYAAPTIYKDAQRYNRYTDQPTFRPGQFRQILPRRYHHIDECGGNGWYGEETLDVEAVHAMAPGAKVVYVAGSDCITGLDEAWAATIDNHVADVITNSWTDGTDDINLLGQDYVDFYNQFSLEAALTGITVNFSSGDDGDLTSGGTDLASKSVEFPADVPWVSGIGGTSVGISKSGTKLWEHGWQTDYSPLSHGAWGDPAYSSGGGGGTSFLYAQPFYQKGRVPASISKYFSAKPMRAVPDISMPGDPNTGFLVGETQVFPDGTYWDVYRIGGTSLSSPLMAGVVAVLDSAAHQSIGFANPLYYRLARTSAIDDIVAPRRPVLQVRTNYVNSLDASDGRSWVLQTVDTQSTTIHSRRGYDAETGVGTPDVAALLRIISSSQ